MQQTDNFTSDKILHRRDAENAETTRGFSLLSALSLGSLCLCGESVLTSKGIFQMSDIIKHYLEDSIIQFQKMKAHAEKAMAQVSDDEFFHIIDVESNSLAIIVKHVGGNLLSRWTDFLTSDGEKEWRQRDREFIIETADSRERLMQLWEDGWRVLFHALEPLQAEDFENRVMIRGEPHTIVEAINRQLTHYSHHIGQMVFLAKHMKSIDWKTLSIARGKSEDFRQDMLNRFQAK